MTRAVLFSLSLPLVALLGTGCGVVCDSGLEPQDGTCVPIVDDTDDDDTDLDTGTDEPDEINPAFLTLEWTIDTLPSDNRVSLNCDDREVFAEDDFNTRKTHTFQYEGRPGEVCEVRIEDTRGGLLAGGRLVTCSEEVASWDEERGYDEVRGTATLVECIEGCPDPVAENYDPEANLDNGECEYILGCTDERALNYDPTATKDDGRCDFGGFGLVEVSITTDNHPEDTYFRVTCDGYDVLAEDNFSDVFTTEEFEVLVDSGFDCEVYLGDLIGDQGAGGSVTVCGELQAEWDSFVPQVPPGGSFGEVESLQASFFMPVCSGCTDPTAPEYDETALVDDGSCSVSDF